MTLFHETGDSEALDVEVAVPIVAPVVGTAELAVHELPARRTANGIHAGSYSELERCHRAIALWAEQSNVALGEWFENVYRVGPAQTQDPNQLRTEVRW